MPRARPVLPLSVFLLGLALVAACGRDGPKVPSVPTSSHPATQEGAAGAQAVVEAYLAAARLHDEAGMLALGTPAWQAKEKAEARAFTPAIASRKFALKSATVREVVTHAATAEVSVRAVFLVDGEEDNEGMRFSLVRDGGRWWIADLG
jgi:hypothetical protein